MKKILDYKSFLNEDYQLSLFDDYNITDIANQVISNYSTNKTPTKSNFTKDDALSYILDEENIKDVLISLKYNDSGSSHDKNRAKDIAYMNNITIDEYDYFINNHYDDIDSRVFRHYDLLVKSLQNSNNNHYTLYREITFDDKPNKVELNKRDGLGHYWTYDFDYAYAYDRSQNNDYHNLIFEVDVDYGQIDWKKTLYTCF